ncbi:hypothetical protein PENFLA_c009G01751 [Penicillium flavigenum]|uniref:Uncharacterized protein n=1 Tax=Penicillium flavigenum TaxID=254877 RepID=A0A1V6TEG9_9EURO|nr:hypothetical protein PENFLA_c009G01751 [Penicillium flavigenum]
MHMNDEFKPTYYNTDKRWERVRDQLPQDRAGPMTPALPYRIEDGFILARSNAPSLHLKNEHHLGLHTPYVAAFFQPGREHLRLSNWDEQDLLYEVQSQDQHTNMVNVPEGIDSIYPADLTKPMAEILQLVYAANRGK